jgi:glycosyltransferase involved in cell wall biosynthesis
VIKDSITVIIPTYNRELFLKSAFESVITQTHKATEIIIVDDGSTDNTELFLHEISQKYCNVKIIRQQNSGVSSARNRGIEAATSEWITFLDSDDRWDKNKLKEQFLFHHDTFYHDEILVSYTDEVWIRNNQVVKIPKKFKKPKEMTLSLAAEYCNIAPSSIMIHFSVFEKVGLFDETLEVCEDYDLWIRILLHYKIHLLDKKLIDKYAGHTEQLSMKYWGMDRFRTQSLYKITQNYTSEIVLSEILIQKYLVLIKGAIKYNKADDESYYQSQIEKIKILLQK